MLVGIVGKPSSGKSTLLNALCLTDAKMGDYPFTTIQPNRGVSFVRVECPCGSLNEDCNPRTGFCEGGVRYVPIEMLDVAGLVPGASEGKGMGNKFLDDLRQAHALIHVVDSSGTTDEEGNKVESHDASKDIAWLNSELEAWIFQILFGDWQKASRRLEQDPTKAVDLIVDKLSGLGATVSIVKDAIKTAGLLGTNPRVWTVDEQKSMAHNLRLELFPMVIAANKMDMANSSQNIEKMKVEYKELKIIPTSGLAELTLRKASEDGIIQYKLGSDSFSFQVDPETDKRSKILEAIGERILQQSGSTGVTVLLEFAVFELLNLIPVFPVENQTKLTDHDGRILPDVFLVPKGTTAKQFAGKIHSDLQDNFINAILITDNNKPISADHELGHADVVKINAKSK
ncbi:MAG: YchF-related putative GTPase [Candidatus Kariarchaeaceae archaeon]|jgi:ribosome-binding ATPase YchF (GTP1/OBG family)